METLTVSGTRTFASLPESVRAARAWVTSYLPGSPAAGDAALMVSELFTNAILYSTSGHSGGSVTVIIAISRSMARIDVIDQGGALDLRQAAFCVAAAVVEATRLGAGLTIVRELADASGDDGPDKWFTLCVDVPAGPAEGGPR
ncbi:MAG: ATP-binding protein [Streptosporangiaceae bacterium]